MFIPHSLFKSSLNNFNFYKTNISDPGTVLFIKGYGYSDFRLELYVFINSEDILEIRINDIECKIKLRGAMFVHTGFQSYLEGRFKGDIEKVG